MTQPQNPLVLVQQFESLVMQIPHIESEVQQNAQALQALQQSVDALRPMLNDLMAAVLNVGK